jgi:hypothetical protein
MLPEFSNPTSRITLSKPPTFGASKHL